MIATFEDVCTWMYVTVDDLWRTIAPLVRRPGPAPRCSDSELITMALVGECCEWDKETTLLAAWRRYPRLFPVVPERSRFNRRRRDLTEAIGLLRRLVLAQFDLAQDRPCALDSLPVPVVHVHLAPAAAGRWAVWGARYGHVPSKHVPIFGFKLHVVITLGGVVRDFRLVAANTPEAQAGADLLADHTDLVVVADKGYVHADLAAALQAECAVTLLALPRANQRPPWPESLTRLVLRFRQLSETVNSQLAAQFHIEENHAVTFRGLCARLATKLTAHTLCTYLNRLLGAEHCLRIKHVALTG